MEKQIKAYKHFQTYKGKENTTHEITWTLTCINKNIIINKHKKRKLKNIIYKNTFIQKLIKNSYIDKQLQNHISYTNGINTINETPLNSQRHRTQKTIVAQTIKHSNQTFYTCPHSESLKNISTHTHTQIHTQRNSHINSNTHRHRHKQKYRYTQTDRNTHKHTHKQLNTHTNTNTHADTHMHTHTNTQTNTHKHTKTHRNKQTHTCKHT